MPRKEFSARVKLAAYTRSRGICEVHRLSFATRHGAPICSASLGEGNTFYEHIVVDHNSHDNSLENCAVLCKTCWRWKTDTYDKPVIAKTKRQHRRAIGIRKPTTFKGWRNFRGERIWAK